MNFLPSLRLGSHWLAIGCVHIVSRELDAVPNNNEFGIIFAERTKLGTNDHRAASFGKMATHFEIFRMLFDADRSGEANSIETSQLDGMEQWRQRRSQVSKTLNTILEKGNHANAFRCRLLRPEVLLASVLWEETEAINQAKQLLHNFLTNGSVIPANLREVNVLLMAKFNFRFKLMYHFV